nr:type I restriction enzyme HsdR N-terminal domain-containing protein [uncultured Lacibacter sp.]
MIKIEYPQPAFRIKEDEGKEFIFDDIRKLWVRLTPEEWVRQNMLQYLIQIKEYPSVFISIEKEINLGVLRKRFDVLVFNSEHKPWLMIECKAMDVELSEKTLEQIVRYNISIPVPYLVISNGSFTYAWEKKENRLISISELPVFH